LAQKIWVGTESHWGTTVRWICFESMLRMTAMIHVYDEIRWGATAVKNRDKVGRKWHLLSRK